MKTWVVGGLVVAVAGGAYFLQPKPAAAPPAPAPVFAEAVPVAPAAPPTFADVVNVTNIDALLDPPQIPVADSDDPPATVVVDVSADHAPHVRPVLPATIPAAAD